MISVWLWYQNILLLIFRIKIIRVTKKPSVLCASNRAESSFHFFFSFFFFWLVRDYLILKKLDAALNVTADNLIFLDYFTLCQYFFGVIWNAKSTWTIPAVHVQDAVEYLFEKTQPYIRIWGCKNSRQMNR